MVSVICLKIFFKEDESKKFISLNQFSIIKVCIHNIKPHLLQFININVFIDLCKIFILSFPFNNTTIICLIIKIQLIYSLFQKYGVNTQVVELTFKNNRDNGIIFLQSTFIL